MSAFTTYTSGSLPSISTRVIGSIREGIKHHVGCLHGLPQINTKAEHKWLCWQIYWRADSQIPDLATRATGKILAKYSRATSNLKPKNFKQLIDKQQIQWTSQRG